MTMDTGLALGLGLVAAGLGAAWYVASPAKKSGGTATPGHGGGTGTPKVFVDRATAQDDWNTGALVGASNGYDAGKVPRGDAGPFDPTTHAKIQPAGVESFGAYSAGYNCGAVKGYALGQKALSMFGSAAAKTSFDASDDGGGGVIKTACAPAFDAWWAKHGSEPAIVLTGARRTQRAVAAVTTVDKSLADAHRDHAHHYARRLPPAAAGRTLLSYAPPRAVRP